jgi:hypothetical protein
VLQYYDSLKPGDKPKEIWVATSSEGLRSVYPVVNNVKEVETILDSGSQIISMSSKVALSTGIGWDPDIRIHMQSANKSMDLTMGLAKNVPFTFHDITVYLQVHVIEDPAYTILLGRPFDVLTTSNIQNLSNGGQTVTIKDPNSGKRCTMPTFERGVPPASVKGANFQAPLMN